MKKIFTFFCLILFASIIYGQMPKSQRLVLVEEFTQASCGPCASANPTLNTLLAANTAKVVSLKYQTSWPGVDPMNAQNPTDVASRVSYYGWISGVPTVVLDGDSIPNWPNSYTGYPGALTQTVINTEYAVSSPFTIALSHTYTTNYDSINIVCNIVATTAASYTGPLVLQVALTEQQINFAAAPGTNGETVFYNVMRDMVPTASGTTLATTWTLNQADPHTFKVKIPTYIYDKSQIGIVAFIQDGSNKKVKQAAYSVPIPLSIDAKISSISGILPFSCVSSVTPIIALKNNGTTTLTTATIKYKATTAGTYTNYTWNGTLAAGATSNVTLPATSVTAGSNTFYVSVSLPNGLTDYNTVNDLITQAYTIGSSTGGTVPPIVEGFTLTTFPPTGWMYVDVTADGLNWNRSTTVGGFGNSTNSARIDFYSISSGEMDDLYIKPVDLNTASSASLVFSVAYAQYSTSYVDTIKVMVSTNCGTTWATAFVKYGSTLATAPAYGSGRFVPIASQWRSETVSLSPYIGHSGVYVKFHAGSDYGNDAYIDDINLSIITSTDNISIEKNIEVFPNPSNGIVNITNLENANVIIYNLIGSKMFELNNANGNKQLDLSKFENGAYIVQVKSNNKVITQKLVLNK